MMGKETLSRKDWILFVLGVAFLPVAFQLAGSAFYALIFPKLTVDQAFVGERLAFLVVALGIYCFCQKVGLLKTNLLRDFTYKWDGAYYLAYLLALSFTVAFLVTEAIQVSLFWVLVNLLIAWQEELVYRLMLPNFLEQAGLKDYYVAIIQGLLFTFIAHLDGDLLVGLLIRFPLSLLFYAIFAKSRRLVYPVLLHCTWNLYVIYFT